MGWDVAGEPGTQRGTLEILRNACSTPGQPRDHSSPLAESPGISEVAILSALQNKRCQRSKGKMLRGPYAPVGPEHKSTFNLL